MLFDVHSHLDLPQFDPDREKVIERAYEAGVFIVNSGLGPESIERTLRLSRGYDNVFATLGLSPQEFDQGVIDKTIELIRKHRKEIIGIGEVGLDYYWVKDDVMRKKEHKNLGLFRELSIELNLPLVIHSRDAEEDIIQILQDDEISALLHCFSGSVGQAKNASSFGCLISVPTSVVYSKKKQRMVKELPLECIVLETDAPYLSPQPRTRNEPVNILSSRDMIAKIKGVDECIVEEVTTENAKQFFNLKGNLT